MRQSIKLEIGFVFRHTLMFFILNTLELDAKKTLKTHRLKN